MASRNICVVGPRSSGKTTYLASLAYHEEHIIQHNKKSKYTVTPVGTQAEELKNMAKTLLRDGGEIEVTRIGDKIQTVDDLPFYSFGIKGKLSWRSPVEEFQITTRDYPGEVFDSLVTGRLSDSIREGFIHDCFDDKGGCMMLLPGWELGSDSFYQAMLERFVELMDSVGQKQTYKMAIVLSKCERGEIWPGRLEPELDLFQLHLKETTKYLRRNIKPENLRFFAMSTFGVRGRNDPRPNRRDFITKKGEPGSVLFAAGQDQWQPYNLIEPLRWLIKD